MFWLYFAIALSWCLLILAIETAFGIALFTGAPFAVSKQSKVAKIISLAKSRTSAGARALDLGSGDGRIVIALARAGYQADGIEINPLLVWWSRLRIKQLKLQDKAAIIKRNFWQEDLGKYDLIVIFGIFYMMEKLEKKLAAELRPGAIVICNFAQLPNWTAIQKEGDVYIYQK